MKEKSDLANFIVGQSCVGWLIIMHVHATRSLFEVDRRSWSLTFCLIWMAAKLEILQSFLAEIFKQQAYIFMQAACQRMRGDCKAVMFSGLKTGRKCWVLLPFVLTVLLLASSPGADAQLTSTSRETGMQSGSLRFDCICQNTSSQNGFYWLFLFVEMLLPSWPSCPCRA